MYRIKEIKPLEGLRLLATFFDNTQKIYDVNPLLDKWQFEDLKTIKGLFELVKVDVGGYGIVWNDYLDLASEEIWENGVVVGK